MEEVIVLPEVQQKLKDLVDVLYAKGYFGTMETAVKYVQSIRSFIYTIPSQHRYPTLRKRYGAWYCRYKPNRHTTWYITFDTDEDLWVVRNIINNHTPDYPAFIKGLK